jgi:hypothetical protein
MVRRVPLVRQQLEPPASVAMINFKVKRDTIAWHSNNFMEAHPGFRKGNR